MQLGAEAFSEFACMIDNFAADHSRGDEMVVAVDHPFDVGGAWIGRFGIRGAGSVEAGGIDHRNVGAFTLRQVAGVEAVPVGELAGQPAHRGLDGQTTVRW